MSKKLITSIIFAIVLVVFVIISYLLVKPMSQNQAIALWFSAGGILVACALSFLLAESKPITFTISIIYVVLAVASGAFEMSFKGGLDAKWTIIIQLVLLAVYVIACLLRSGASTINDYEKDENGKNIYKKAG